MPFRLCGFHQKISYKIYDSIIFLNKNLFGIYKESVHKFTLTCSLKLFKNKIIVNSKY